MWHEQLQAAVAQHSWVAFSALAIAIVVNLLKTEYAPKIFPWISSSWRVLVALLLGQIGGVLENLLHGMQQRDAILRGLAATGLALLAHDLMIEHRKGKEIFDLSGRTSSKEKA